MGPGGGGTASLEALASHRLSWSAYRGAYIGGNRGGTASLKALALHRLSRSAYRAAYIGGTRGGGVHCLFKGLGLMLFIMVEL